MNKKLHTEAVDHLFEAILCLKTKEECYTFFEDVCTINDDGYDLVFGRMSESAEASDAEK